jgi:hypothetical protein
MAARCDRRLRKALATVCSRVCHSHSFSVLTCFFPTDECSQQLLRGLCQHIRKPRKVIAYSTRPFASAGLSRSQPDSCFRCFFSRVLLYRMTCAVLACHMGRRALVGVVADAADVQCVRVAWDTTALAQGLVQEDVERQEVIPECDLLTAVTRKYGDEGDLAVPSAMTLDTKLLNRLRTIDLRSCALSSLAGLEASACPNLQILDLSCNLLSSLSAVAAFLVGASPTLKSLNISDNAFAADLPFTSAPSPHTSSAEGTDTGTATDRQVLKQCRLETLAMNNMGNSSESAWDMLFALIKAAHLGHLKELSLEDNALTSAPTACLDFISTLESIRMDGNLIQTWGGISILGDLPRLSRLTLSRNPLRGTWCEVAGHEGENVRGHDGEGEGETDGTDGGGSDLKQSERASQKRFSTLRSLSLNSTGINSWEQVDALARLSSLRDVRLQDVELTRGMSSEAQRMLVIAHLPNVSSGGKGRQTVGSETCGLLNGGMITANERRDAHRFFLEYWERVGPEERPARYCTLLQDDPIAKKLAGVGDGAAVDDDSRVDISRGGVVDGGYSGQQHLFDGVTASSFSARGLGRCE